MESKRSGACLCGKVRFETDGDLRPVLYCHCSQCRKQTGLYYAATDVADSELQIHGEEHITWFAATNFAKRGFCATCGSALFWKRNGADRTSVMAGAFEQPTRLRAEAHIFVADKGDFYDIDDGLPVYQGAPRPS